MNLTPPQQLFLDFIRAREHARIAKEMWIHPHSDDPIIRDYKFCNINREHDRVTIWVKENVRDKLKDMDDLIVSLAVARVFNHPPTLEALRGNDSENYSKILAELKLRGKIFRGAYKMPAHGCGGEGVSSADYFLKGIKKIADMDFSECKTLESVADLIQQARGFGPFLANQITTDLRYTEFFKNAPDWETFVLCGPGTKKGLCAFFGEKPRKGGSQLKAAKQLAGAKTILEPHLESPFNEYFRDPNNLTNSFCEFFKYFRALHGGSTPKSKYTPYGTDRKKHK